MKIKFSRRFAAILVAAGVSATLRACTGTLTETSSHNYNTSRPSLTSTDTEYNTKEGYILDSNFDLVGEEEKLEELDNGIGTKR